jgi:hypothetical protein
MASNVGNGMMEEKDKWKKKNGKRRAAEVP